MSCWRENWYTGYSVEVHGLHFLLLISGASLQGDLFLTKSCIITWYNVSISWSCMWVCSSVYVHYSFLVSFIFWFLSFFRYGTSELCRTHCAFLIEILSQTHIAPTSTQHLVVVTLLSRLMGKLSPSHKEDIRSRFNAVGLNG